MLDGFEIARFLFDFRAEESGYLPGYKGGLLRGGFGYTFRSVACHQRGQDCRECKDKGGCAYSYIFETSPTQDDGKFSGYSDAPRPFVVEPDSNRRRKFVQGDSLEFGLVLIGKAIEYFPYFIFCFDELGRRGLGREKVRFRLEGVHGFHFRENQWFSVYDPRDRLLNDNLPAIGANQLSLKYDDTLSLEFLTPTRIKYRDKYISDLEFHVMIRNLLRRISMLMLYHCDTELDADINRLIAEARMVDVHNWDLRWRDWPRYSTRQNAEISLGGFVGKVTYVGNFDKFMPVIALGEQIHIGKNTTFGLGKYRIRHQGSGS